MAQAPDVTVIVAVFNGMPHIEATIRSLIGQTLGLDRMQVIVVDDGSTDETPDVLDAFARAYPLLEIIHQENSGGPAGPRNRALDLARGRYTFFLDADDYLSDDALEAMVSIADTNGTDVVLAKVKGVGGRTASRRMFADTQPRTDVFSSEVYWALNPMKLFRTELINSLGLRFPVDLPWGEDQPFVAAAMLKGSGISVLADKDYIFWAYRDDGLNITKTAVSLADRMPVADLIFDFVGENVPAGKQRDRLMTRHFHVELFGSAFPGYLREPSLAARESAFARFRELVDAYYTPSIEAALPPAVRVLMRLVSEGRHEEFGRYLEALQQSGEPELVADDGAVYLALPWFRQPDADLPDALFDVTAQARFSVQSYSMAVGVEALRLSMRCRLGSLSPRVTGLSLVCISREGGRELEFPLVFELERDEARVSVVVDGAVSGGDLAECSAGLWDVFVRIRAGAYVRGQRLAWCVEGTQTLAVLWAEGRAPERSLVLYSTQTGSLSLRSIAGLRAVAKLETDAHDHQAVLEVFAPTSILGSGVPHLTLENGRRPVQLPFTVGSAAGEGSMPLRASLLRARPGSFEISLSTPSGKKYPVNAMVRGYAVSRVRFSSSEIRVSADRIEMTPVWRARLGKRVARLRAKLKRIAGRSDSEREG